MAACCAGGCRNKATKDIMRVFRFPAGKRHGNEERRKKWITNIKRENWTPTKGSYVCEEHFDEDQWEPRRLGKRKLKWNAVPTIFPNKPQVQIRKPPKLRVLHNAQGNSAVIVREISTNGEQDQTERLRRVADNCQRLKEDPSDLNGVDTTTDELSQLRAENCRLKDELRLLNEKYNGQAAELSMTKTRLTKLETKIKLLSKEDQLLFQE